MWVAIITWVCLGAVAHGAYIKDGEEEERSTDLMVIPVGPVPRASLRQIFKDDFNSLDKSKWTLDSSAVQAHNEFEIYSPDPKNCYTRGGLLYIRPTLTSDKFSEDFLHNGVLDMKKLYGYCNPNWYDGCIRDAKKLGIMPPVMSCMMRSKMSFKYGKLEIVARMPKGDWIWPALWVMPKDSKYGIWPRSGEIDLIETTGNINYGNLGVQRVMSSLHLGDSGALDKHVFGEHFLHGQTYADRFYKYVLDWTADYIKIYADDVLVYGVSTPANGMHDHYGLKGPNIWGNSKNAPFDQPFYILMNVAVGGTEALFYDWVRNYPHPMPWKYKDNRTEAMEKFWKDKDHWWPTWHGEEAAMRVDSVTVWTY